MDSQNSNTTSQHDHASSAGSSGSEHWPKYWVMEGTEANKPLSKLNPFLVYKGVQAISSTLQVQRLRNGTLMLECDKRSQATTLSKMKEFMSIPVRVTPHKTLNSSQGVIRCWELSDMSDEEITHELSPQGITKVRRFKFRKDQQVQRTNSLLLAFDTPTPPKSINVGYLRVRVEVYIPNPLRCYKCQRYGHGQRTCKGQQTCFKCGLKDHEAEACQNPAHCVNCHGNHAASSKQCPSWIKECEIQKV